VISNSSVRHSPSVRGMGFVRAATFVALVPILAVINSPASRAEGDTGTIPAVAAPAPVPTIRILAIGRLTAKAKPPALGPVLQLEVPATVRLYLAGKIDQWYITPDESAVVFIMNASTTAEAHGLLGKLPLGQAGMMEFELIPLGPLNPLRLLLSEPPK
jgi:hypothetical protein